MEVDPYRLTLGLIDVAVKRSARVYGRTSVDSFYADRNGADLLCRTLGLVTAGRGANVDITVIDDPGFFRDAIEPVAGIRCTSVVQTYLDLFASGERGREAADHLRQEKLQWKN